MAVPAEAGVGLLGRSVALEGDLALIGAVGDDAGGLASGSAYVFLRDATGWSQAAKLVAEDASGGDYAGGSVATDGARALVGADGWDPGGAAYVFRLLPGALGSAVCAGDGSAGACPCGNESAPGSTAGCAKSTGAGGRLAAGGSASLTADELWFLAADLPPGQPVLLAAGTGAAGPANASGDGLMHMLPPFVRLGVRATDGFGGATWGPDDTAQAGLGPGETRTFQAWYRDPVAGPGATGFNLTDGRELTLLP